MLKKSTTIGLIIILFTALSMQTHAQDKKLSGREIMLKVDNIPDGDDRKSTMHITLINHRGRTRERTVLSYQKDYGKDTKTIMYFLKPADVKGIGFLSYEYDDLSKDDDRWLYLPALKKVRRISGSSKNDYFIGTDFTYDDMGGRSVDENTHKLLREEEANGFKYWVVESIPKDKDYMYSKTIEWIRQDSYIAVKIEYYNQMGTLMKIFTTIDVRKEDGFWTVFKMEMDNKQEKHKTILELEEVHYNTKVKDSLFRVSTLERGRLR